MASSTKIIDTQKRVVYKFLGNTDEASGVYNLKVDAGSLNFALSNTGAIYNSVSGIATSNTRQTRYELAIKKVIYSISSNNTSGNLLEIAADGYSLAGTNSNTILILSGSGEMKFAEGGDSFTVNNIPLSTSTGNINFRIPVATTGLSYTVIVDFRKNPTNYDQGAAADPTAFNR